ncbi:MAG: heme exporter protein CcmD [Gammaproteobacteria bacterium]
MGGAAPYVWGSYGVALLLFAVELYLLRSRHRRTLLQIRAMRRFRKIDTEQWRD